VTPDPDRWGPLQVKPPPHEVTKAVAVYRERINTGEWYYCGSLNGDGIMTVCPGCEREHYPEHKQYIQREADYLCVICRERA
jgi:transposase-like protein